ncbi:unnamed protein product [Neisseria lactamica Y92-1009]|nr:unnamed protein product [Neisseria lactamica Y92-1009]
MKKHETFTKKIKQSNKHSRFSYTGAADVEAAFDFDGRYVTLAVLTNKQRKDKYGQPDY